MTMNTEQLLLGTTANLYVLRFSRFGVYLGSGTDRDFEVLLPNNQVSDSLEKGDKIDVFLYKDSEDRLMAALKVKDITNIGAFLDWGLAKDLFLPFKEQTARVRMGDTVLVTLYIDKSERLCATMKIYDYLSCESPYKKGDKVHGRIYEITDSFGCFVAVDDEFSALIPHNEMTRVGEEVDARVKEVTEEGKLTLSLQEKVKVQMGMDAERIYSRLEEAGGYLPFHDKTSPEIIKREFQISKAAFKRAIGRLMKQKKIQIKEDGIHRL